MPDIVWFGSVAGFALASSISPGPVNLLTLSHVLGGNVRHSWRFISGATLGFVLQLCGLGLALQSLLRTWPGLSAWLHVGGLLFVVYLAWLLWFDGGNARVSRHPIGLGYGLLLQWLNPKAYLAVAAVVGVYVGDSLTRLYWLAAVYGAVCWLSLAAWIGMGLALRRYVQAPYMLRRLNRSMSVLLLFSLLLML